jgi:hypothetical protein
MSREETITPTRATSLRERILFMVNPSFLLNRFNEVHNFAKLVEKGKHDSLFLLLRASF